ncbi:hypothetical protein SAQ01S_18020 [Sphingomonas aquatilis NBRC 16722]|uniref:Uncharacterized protein n=1 Tax=Sphingomonas aquatilis TaxID=93063 RepID=A0AAW3TQH9_9SPHN|nr:hypothetical protein [Sphingomonas aquatilis]MBB3875295.1 hypothetical protein [Sphingomonas aquatilis]GEM72036.1 hypothetical protein SAQ01S_18020 [Sphingomonas aquatilis NBRC 16722]
MAHSRFALTTMLDWIERCLTDGIALLPTDAEIMERYGFTSPEHARTLLAELADAGKITIRGYGADRVIVLGRVRAAVAPLPRVVPPARRVDAEIDQAVTKIRGIVNRQGAAVRKAVEANAEELLNMVNPSPAAPTPPLRKQENRAMAGAKSIQLPSAAASAIEAVERLAEADGISLGIAAATLIERGMSVQRPTANAVAPSLEEAIEMLRAAFGARPDHSAELAEERDARVAAEARAVAAELKLEAVRAAFA